MAQQTAIEWLLDEIEKQAKAQCEEIPIWIYIFCEQAKEMHKEETMDAFQAGKWDWSTHLNHGKNSMDPAEYYNETFK